MFLSRSDFIFLSPFILSHLFRSCQLSHFLAQMQDTLITQIEYKMNNLIIYLEFQEMSTIHFPWKCTLSFLQCLAFIFQMQLAEILKSAIYNVIRKDWIDNIVNHISIKYVVFSYYKYLDVCLALVVIPIPKQINDIKILKTICEFIVCLLLL